MIDYIVGVGHCCADHICTIEQYPPEDGSTHITAMEEQGGGAVGTALVAAARLGASARLIGNTGDDAIGDSILDGFRQEQVDTSLVERIPGGRSSSSYVMVDPLRGTRTKFPFHDALPSIIWTEEKKQAVGKAAVLHLDGTQYDNAWAAAQIARAAGVPVSLDGCSMRPDNERNVRLASAADFLIMNARYPLRVSGKDSMEEALLTMARWGPRVVISTCGKDGCFLVQDGQVLHLPAFPVQAVDTTGAGDVFHGAFLAGWLRKMPLLDCIRFASAVSALKCLKPGGRAGIPSLEQVSRFLREQGGSWFQR